MISKKLEEAINEQIANELWSSNLYLSMSFFCAKEGYSGFAAWLEKQSLEERTHASMMADFVIKRGGTAKVETVKDVPFSWETPLALFRNVYGHECKVSQMINNLLKIAKDEGDFAAEDFMWQFVREQVQEEATADDIVTKVEKFGENALYDLDSTLGKRQN